MLDLPAIKKQNEEAVALIDDEVPRLVARYSPAAAMAISALLGNGFRLVEALEEAGEALQSWEEGKRLLLKYGSHLVWCRARNNMIPGAGKTECDCGFYRAALAPGKTK